MLIEKERLVALKNELVMAERLNKEELEPIMADSLRRYIGNYAPPIGMDWDIILNELYPIIQNELPSIFFRNPRAFLKPRNRTFIVRKRDPISGKMVDTEADSTKSARTQEDILNYDLSQIKYKKQMQKVLLDALLFPYGILWHGYKGDFGMTEEQSIDIKDDRNFVRRLNPLRFLKDPAVPMADLDEAKWIARSFDVTLVDVIEDDKLDVDKELLKGFEGFGQKLSKRNTLPPNQIQMIEQGKDKILLDRYNRTLLGFTTEDYKKSKNCRFIKLYEVFLRPTKKEKREGGKGYILLLTDEQFKPLRENEWTIKAEGWPGKVLEFNPLNDNMFGLSDPEAFGNVIDQKNSIINLQLRNAQENSKVWVGLSKEGADEEDVLKVQKGEQTIILFESGKPSERMYVASPGGSASSELYLIDQRIQRNLEDKSGITDLRKGFLQSGEESATSVQLRNAGGGARPAYRQDIMSDFLKDSFLYLNQLNKQFMSVKDAVRVVGSLDIEWSEKPTKEEIQADVDVEIDVISMLPENPEKELKELNTALMLMIDGIRDPAIQQKLQQEGKTLNLSPLIEQMLVRLRIKNPDIFRNIKEEEGMGFVSVQQLKQAQENVQAAITGQQIPYPPSEKDDHRAKVETYTAISNLLQQMGQQSDILMQLIQIHMAMIQQNEQKQANPGMKISLPKPSIQTVGS
jgi:hypothetical protein